MWRHHPQAKEAARLVASGAIGELRTIRAAFAFRGDDPTTCASRRASTAAG